MEDSHRALDNFVSELAQFVDVLIMSGILDASDGYFPQNKICELTQPKGI